MSLDPYSLCPCESGKKLKFCCADIAAEMMKALQLHESGQSRAALKILEKLHHAQPARPWVATSLAGVLLFLESPEGAREVLQPLLEESPDHPLGRILDATAALDLEGYDHAKTAIHRAFVKGVKQHPEMVGSMAAGIASLLYEEGRYLSARQHLTFAMKFVREEDRQQIFMRLLDFDGEQSIAYPLRGVHNLKTLDLPEEDQKTCKKAMGLSSVGCWHEAAAVMHGLTAKHPENADVWYNTGLFYAWDGDHKKAAQHFHQAATLSQDRELAISCETLAQILDLEENAVEDVYAFYQLQSIEAALEALNASKYFQKTSDQTTEQAPSRSISRYFILDREIFDKIEGEETDLNEKVPQIVGVLMCGAEGFENAGVGLMRITVHQEHLEQVQDRLKEVLNDLAVGVESPPFTNTQTFSQWKDYYNLCPQNYLPETISMRVRGQLEAQKWEKITRTDWPNRPLMGLNGKTPLEAKDQPELAHKLAAAVNVFDAYAAQYKHKLDVDWLKSTLNIPASATFEIQQDNQLNSCDVLQMLRISIEDLTDSQLSLLINRAQLILHPNFSERVLEAVLNRTGIIDDQRMTQTLHGYIDLARDSYQVDLMLERINFAKQWAQKSGQKFEEMLQWEIRELQVRITDPEQPEFTTFLEQLYSRFLRKFPELEAIIRDFLIQYGITPPWNNSELVFSGKGNEPQDLWTPGGSKPSAVSKLWLPGQD